VNRSQIAAEIVRWLETKLGPAPPGFVEKVEGILGKKCPHSQGVILVVATCMCEYCQEQRAQAVRESVEPARRLQRTILRNAQAPCMN